MLKWFICHNETVRGPLTTEEVRNNIKDGDILRQSLVWGSVMEHWRTVSWWETELPTILKSHKENKDNRLWHYAQDGQSHGPFTRNRLIQELNQLKLKDDVMIWTKGMPTWGQIFEFTDLMDEVGVSRRAHPRAPIKGSVIIKSDNKAALGKLSMISEGGCGVINVEGLKAGEFVNLDIKSAAFSEPVRAKAQVRYVTETGYVGLKFAQIGMESKARIIEYVKGSSGAGKTAA